MKALIISLLMVTGVAKADGFKCYVPEFDQNIKVFNHTQAEEGTRNASIMIISDEAVNAGRKTVATFSDVKNTLDNAGASYVAKVDLRVSESNRKGENVFGTKLGEIATVKLNVYFTYGEILINGESVEGKLIVSKRNGDKITAAVECVRYLKN